MHLSAIPDFLNGGTIHDFRWTRQTPPLQWAPKPNPSPHLLLSTPRRQAPRCFLVSAAAPLALLPPSLAVESLAVEAVEAVELAVEAVALPWSEAVELAVEAVALPWSEAVEAVAPPPRVRPCLFSPCLCLCPCPRLRWPRRSPSKSLGAWLGRSLARR